MSWILVLITVIVFLLLMILLLKIKVAIKYWYQKESHYIVIKVTLLKMRIFQKKINLDEQTDVQEHFIIGDVIREMKSEHEVENFKQLMTALLNRMKQAKSIVLAFLHILHIHQFEWKTYFGTGEASSTGVASGGIWMVKGSLIGFFYELATFRCEPKIAVIPYFQQKGFRSEINCIVSFRLGKAIYTVMQVLRNSNVKKEVYI